MRKATSTIALLALVLVLVTTAFMVACTSNQIITDAEMAISGIELALPLVSTQAGISPALLSEIMDYLDAGSRALGQLTDVLAAGGPASTVAIRVTALFSGIVAQDAKIQADIGGLPSAIISAIHVVTLSLEKILTQYGTAAATSHGLTAGKPAPEYHFTGRSAQRLQVAKAKAVELQGEIRGKRLNRK